MNTKHYWSILFLLCAVFISLLFSVFLGNRSILEKGLVEGIVATPLVWFTSPYTQELSSSDLHSIISEIQQNPELLDNPGTITGIINNPTIMNNPTIAAAIASNTTYMNNTTISTNQYVSAAVEAIPLVNPVKNVTPLTSANLQQQIAKIQMTPSQLDAPGTITTILNNTSIMDDITIAAAIANDQTYINNTIISVYPTIVRALANNTINPFNNTQPLSPFNIQQQISSIQITPTQLDVPGTITTILNNTSIMNDLTVMAAIINNTTYMNNPIVVQYITSINPNAITAGSTNNPNLNTKTLIGDELKNIITEIQANPTILDTPGTITTILNNKTIMDDPTVASAIITRPTYMNNTMISTYPSISNAAAAANAAATAANPSVVATTLTSTPTDIDTFIGINSDKIKSYNTQKCLLNSYNNAYMSILPTWKS